MDLLPNKSDAVLLPITNTRISASEWNQLVGSCMAFIYAAGFSPDAADNEQFLNAFKKIASELEIVGANTALSNLTSEGQGKFDAKVSKTGDTMTGTLRLTTASGADAAYNALVLRDNRLNRNTTPSGTTAGNFITFTDEKNVFFSRIYNSSNASGENRLEMRVASDEANNTTMGIGVAIKKDASLRYAFLSHATPAESTGNEIATASWVRSYVTSVLPSSLSTQIAPDYAHGQSVTIGADFVPPSNGWLYILAATDSNDSVKLYVDGAEISASISNKGDPGIIRTLVPIYITSGHTYKVTMTQNRDASWNKCYFYPIMGV